MVGVLVGGVVVHQPLVGVVCVNPPTVACPIGVVNRDKQKKRGGGLLPPIGGLA